MAGRPPSDPGRYIGPPATGKGKQYVAGYSSTGKYIGPQARPYTPPTPAPDPFHFLRPVNNFLGDAFSVPKFVGKVSTAGKVVARGAGKAYNPGFTKLPAAKAARVPPAAPPAALIENRPVVPPRPKPVTPQKKSKGTPGKTNTAPVDAKPAPPVRQTAASSTTPAGYTPMTEAAMAHLARLQASAAINFQVQPLIDQIATTNEQSAQHAQAVAGFAKAMGELTAPIGQNLTNAYGSAANAVATYGKGFSSDTLKQDAGANAGAAPELNAAQQAAVQAGYNGMPSDVMYGLHGQDPATSLRQLGTALGGIYGAALPSAATSAGQQWLSSAQSQSLAQLKALQDKVAEVRGGYPAAYQSALSAAQLADRQNQGIQISRDALTAKTAATAAATANAARKVNATLSKAYGVQMNASGELLTGKNGKPIIYPGSTQHVNTTLSKWYKVLVDGDGQAILDANGKRIPVPDSANSSSTSKYNGLTKARYTEFASQAVGLARVAHKPYTGKDGQVHPPVSWQVYLDTAHAKKIPTWVIIEQGRKVYSQDEIHQGLIPGAGPSGG